MATPHGRGFYHDSVERFAVHCRKGRKPYDRLIVLLARNRLHHPNVQVPRRVPMAQGLQIRFLCRHKYSVNSDSTRSIPEEKAPSGSSAAKQN